jgi:hypothetical protein|tara:strand:- start:46470 stop:47663 length:1194 start_codon:yes stop_codon:yes gene_type:complete
MSLLGLPCGIGKNDLEKCGPGLKCEAIPGLGNSCINPCESGGMEGFGGEGGATSGGRATWYQNDPDKPNYGECIQGVGGSTSSGSQSSTSNVPASNTLNTRQDANANRFCLCAIDVGCGPAPAGPPAGELVFNIMWLTPSYNTRDAVFGDYGDFGSGAQCSHGNYNCDRPRVTLAAMWLKRDDNNEICVEGPCCKNGGDGTKAIDPRVTKAGDKECPSGSADQECSNILPGNTKNGVAQTFGPNTKGCEALEFYCDNVVSCYRTAAFSNGVQDLFDIGPDDFGGFSAFKATVSTPPEGETYELNVYGHSGEKGQCKGKVWVHEMTKDKTNSLGVKSFSSAGPPRQEDASGWRYQEAPNNPYTYCSTTIGGPNPKALVGQAALLATITLLPDGTWTIS